VPSPPACGSTAPAAGYGSGSTFSTSDGATYRR